MIKLIKSTFYKEAETKEKLGEFIKASTILSMGEECRKFEANFSQKQQRKFSVFVNSGSSANLILIQALINLGRLKKGDKIGFSALTWATNVMPIIQLGLVPVAIDCQIETLNVNSKTLAEKISELKCFFITNALGFCDDLEAIRALCEEHRVLLLEDNCESLGSKAFGKMLGNFGLASTFSFFVGHHLSTIEGGMVCTDDPGLYYMLVMIRAHGWDRNLPKPEQARLRQSGLVDEFYAKYTFYDLAYGVRPTEISGFLGNSQIGYLDEMVGIRQKNFLRFEDQINFSPDLYHIKSDHMETVSNFAVPLVYKTKELCEKYKQRFEDNQVEIRPIIAGDITQQPFYKKYFSASSSCPNARIVHENGFYFPNNPELSEEEVEVLSLILKP